MPGEIPAVPGLRRRKKRDVHAGGRLFFNLLRLFGILVLGLLLAIVAQLIHLSLPAIGKFGASFFIVDDWNPVEEVFGAIAPIYGTLVTSLIAMLIAVPVGLMIAMFLTELCPQWLRRPIGIAIELLAGIPSIIYGIWGLFVFAPFLQKHVQPFLIDTLAAQVKTLAEHQDDSGLWHTLIVDPTSYLEASATAGFAYGILKAVRKGYLPRHYEAVGIKAIRAVLANIDETGELKQVSFGTAMGDTMQFYKDIALTSMPYGQSLAICALGGNIAENAGWVFGVCSPENQPISWHAAKLMEKRMGERLVAGGLRGPAHRARQLREEALPARAGPGRAVRRGWLLDQLLRRGLVRHAFPPIRRSYRRPSSSSL